MVSEIETDTSLSFQNQLSDHPVPVETSFYYCEITIVESVSKEP